jgi:hypothetical protein
MNREPASSPESLVAWQAVVAGEAELRLSATTVDLRAPLRLDFDFHGGLGFVVARRVWALKLPPVYALRLRLRGQVAGNDLELKLVDASGLNVWRHVLKHERLGQRWRCFEIPSSAFEFAWGPGGGAPLEQLGAFELAIVAGPGGSGRLWMRDLEILDHHPAQPTRFTASSESPGFPADAALDRGWRPQPSDAAPWLRLDCPRPRRWGGLMIDWLEGAPAGGFRISASEDGLRWRTLYQAERAGGRRSYVYLPAVKSTRLRLELGESSRGARLHLQSFEFSRSIEAFWHAVAAAEPRGWHPRWLLREQSLWTPVGTPDGRGAALLNEQGLLEPALGSCTLEPMLLVDGRLYTWADVTCLQALRQHWMPAPEVTWETSGWTLHIETEAMPSGAPRVRYRLENLGDRALEARLFVLLRPFQATPPWQRFRELGGLSRIHDLAWRDSVVQVNSNLRIVPQGGAPSFAALNFDDGPPPGYLAEDRLPFSPKVHDDFGFASGVLRFDLSVAARGSSEVALACLPADSGIAGEPAVDWNAALQPTIWCASGWAQEALEAQRTATAHILATRNGPALQPGPRRYRRSWIRDGAIMSAALLRMDCAQPVLDYVRWYAGFQRADGFVPCCVDSEGVDTLVEHDSHGQWIALVADCHRFAGDEALLLELMPGVAKAVGCIEALLDGTGLLPVSVSHEGYLAQPVHSYWDDFWALRGLRDAVALAQHLGQHDEAQRWQALDARFSAALYGSIEDTRRRKLLNDLPASVEWADFDPAATANAIIQLDAPAELDREAVERTFDRYLAGLRERASGQSGWSSYTPYEIRIVGALVRLGRREAALELLQYFLADRRPRAWNQWPEIAWRDVHAPAHVGDVPHTWIAAEYVLAVRSLFVYESEIAQALVIAAGIAPDWMAGEGVRVQDAPTASGRLSCRLRRLDVSTLEFELQQRLHGRIVLRPPLPGPIRSVSVDGQPHASFDAGSVTLPGVPGCVRIHTSGES